MTESTGPLPVEDEELHDHDGTVEPHRHDPPLPKVEATVWRLGPGGPLISSVVERHAATIAASDANAIYFFADLEGSSELKNTEDTMQKVYQALADIGLSEGQIISATNKMQNAGILFRESAV